MGNLESLAQKESDGWWTAKDDGAQRAIQTLEFETWCTGVAAEYGFPCPCVTFHTNPASPYSVENCFVVETLGNRRRARQMRRELNQFSADMETHHDGRHFVHVRDHLTGGVAVVPLNVVPHGVNSIPELDYMIDPWLEVIAYHNNIIVITVREKTKYTPKVVLVCDNAKSRSVGHYPVRVNPNNLNGALVQCCISSDTRTFVLGVLEDHYDEFQMHFHALQFHNNIAQVLCSVRFDQAVWYEPGLQMVFLNSSSNHRVVALGEYPAGQAIADPTRVLIVYNITKQCVEHCRELAYNLFPICLTCSPNGTLIATLSRRPSSWEGNTGAYVVKVYSADNLALVLEIPVSYTIDAFNIQPNCNKIVFSNNSHLLAVTSSQGAENVFHDQDIMGWARCDISTKAYVGIYRLPAIDLTLMGLCRDVILAQCPLIEVNTLPLPMQLKEFLLYQCK